MKIETIHQLNFEDYFKPDVPLADNIYMPGMDGWEDALEDFAKTKLFGCDIETFGSGWWQGLSARHGYIRLISVALPNDKALIVDLGGWKEAQADNREEKQQIAQPFLDILGQKLADINVVTVGQNFKFDALFLLWAFGFHTRNIRDTMLMSQIYWSGVGLTKGGAGNERLTISHGLAHIADRLGIGPVSKEEQKSAWGWDLSNRQLNYSAQDSLIVLKIYYKFKKLFEEENLIYSATAESLACSVFAEMEYAGFPVDVDHARKLVADYEWLRDRVLEPFNTTFPGISIYEQQTLLEAFQQKWPEFGLEAVNATVLNEYRNVPEIDSLLNARSLDISIKYIQKIIELNYDSPIHGPDVKVVNTSFKQIGPAGTGRSTSSEFVASSGSKKAVTGLQLQNPANTPEKFEILYSWFKFGGEVSLKQFESEIYYSDEFTKEQLLPLRSCFVAPPGYKLLVVDLSSAHQRIATQLSRDPVLIDIYNNNRDPHVVMGREIANIDGHRWSEEEMIKYIKDPSSSNYGKAKRYRKVGKVGNYSGLNLGGVTRVRLALKQLGIDATDDDARQVQRAYRGLYKVLYKNILDCIAEANSHDISFSIRDKYGKDHSSVKYGVIRGLTGRRTFGQKKPNKYNEGKHEVALTDMTSFRWLSAEADMIKMMMGLGLLHFDQQPEWGAYFCNFAHDEMNIIVKEEYALECAKYILDLMIKVMSRFIKVIPVIDPKTPLDGSGFICNNWSEK